jgi:hypothetical protein
MEGKPGTKFTDIQWYDGNKPQNKIEKIFKKVEGVHFAEVNYGTEKTK